MQRGLCAICSKRLVEQTVLMDRDGVSYHLQCWVRMMDIRTQETRDAIRKRKASLAERKRAARQRKLRPRRRADP